MRLRIAIIAFLILIVIVGFILGFSLKIDTYYTISDYKEIQKIMHVPGIICAVICGFLVAFLDVLKPSEKNNVFWFLVYVVVYFVITYSYFTDICTDVYGYINMQSKDDYINVSTDNIRVRNIDDELGHARYYIIGVRLDSEKCSGNFSDLKYEISQERYFSIERDENTVRVKVYEGKFGYYHSPEIYRE